MTSYSGKADARPVPEASVSNLRISGGQTTGGQTTGEQAPDAEAVDTRTPSGPDFDHQTHGEPVDDGRTPDGPTSDHQTHGEQAIGQQMRAAVVRRYGPPAAAVVELVDRPLPGRDDVVLRVDAAAVTSGDARMRGGRFPPGFGALARLGIGLRGPRRRVLGGTVAGTVVDIGPAVTGIAVGDRLCGMTGARFGAHAEYIAVKASRLAPIPAGVSADDAAGALFGGTTALHFLRAAGIRTTANEPGPAMPGTPGTDPNASAADRPKVIRPNAGTPRPRVLVNGAAGAIGTNAVQLAARAGATVTAVTSTPNVELVTALGAEHVIDYTRCDLAALTATGARFDVVFDTVGNVSIATGRALLTPTGTLILAVATLGEMIRSVFARRPGRRVLAGTAAERRDDFAALVAKVADGTLTVIHDRTFALDEIAAAHARVDTGHKTGNVIVRP